MKLKFSIIALLMGVFAWNYSIAQIATPTDAHQAESQTTTDGNSLLWEISGNGLEKSSYLFGTIHMIAAEDFFLTNIMKEKFQASEQLALELDMDNPMMFLSAMSGMMMKNGTTLKDLLTEAEYKQVTAHFQKVGMPMFMVNKILPLVTSSMIMEEGGGNPLAGDGGMKSYEMEFMEMAKAKQIEVEGLETVQDQLSVFDSIPYKEQAKMLVEALNGEGDMGNTTFDDMVKLYKAQDLDGLYKLITEDSEDMKQYEDVLLIKRNKNWIPKISKMSAAKPTFFAVGAGHLPGEYGVINLLKAAGYTLTPLK